MSGKNRNSFNLTLIIQVFTLISLSSCGQEPQREDTTARVANIIDKMTGDICDGNDLSVENINLGEEITHNMSQSHIISDLFRFKEPEDFYNI